MATKLNSKEQVVALAQHLIAGMAKHHAGTTQVALLGESFTTAELTSKLEQIVKLRADVNAAKATTKAKLAAEEADMPALRALMNAFVTHTKAAYGRQIDVLADFGIHPKPRAPLTVEAKAAAAAKSKATRAARHTMGTQQRKAIKGDVTGIVVTPVLAAPPTTP